MADHQFFHHWEHDKSGIETLLEVKLHRMPFLTIEAILLISICMKLWNYYNIDYVTICSLNNNTKATSNNLAAFGFMLFIVWFCSFVYCLHAKDILIPVALSPLFLYVFLLIILLQPFNCCLRPTRFWLLFRLYRWISTPCIKISFIDSFFADIMICMNQGLMDIVLFFAFYVNKGKLKNIYSGHTIILYLTVMCLPEWLRLIQCVKFYLDTGDTRQLMNSIKYFSITPVAICRAMFHYTESDYESYYRNPYFTCWIFFSLIRSISYSYWEIKSDAGLFELDAFGQLHILREVILYPKMLYYVYIFENTVLRHFWVIHVIAFETGILSPNVTEWIGQLFEVFRKHFWAIIRIEKKKVDTLLAIPAIHSVEMRDKELREFRSKHRELFQLSRKTMTSIGRESYFRKGGQTLQFENRSKFFRKNIFRWCCFWNWMNCNRPSHQDEIVSLNNEEDDYDSTIDDVDRNQTGNKNFSTMETWTPSPVLNPLWIQEEG